MNILEALKKPFLSNEEPKDLSIVSPEHIVKDLGDDLDLSQLINLTGGIVDQKVEKLSHSDLIKVYRNIASSPDGGEAIDEITNEFMSGIDREPIRLDFQEADISEQIQEKIQTAFDKILRLMKFTKNGQDIFRDWYVDGGIALECVFDESNMKDGIQNVVVLTPHNLYKEFDEKSNEVVYKYSDTGTGMEDYWKTDYNGNMTYLKDQLIWSDSGLKDAKGRKIGFLDRSVKTFNQLSMIEDIIVVYRMTRGTEKRVFKVNVGNMPKNKAVSYMQGLISKFKFNKSYNSETGEVTNNSHLISLTEDIWLPTKNSAKDIEIDTVGSGMNLGELDDIKYFRDKFLKSLKVPANRMNNESQDSMYDLTATEISREELRFLNFIFRLRNKFNDIFLELLKREVVSTKIMTQDEFEDIQESISFKYPDDMKFSETKRLETLSKRIDILNDIEEYVGTYYSREFVKKNVLNLSDDEIQEMKKQIDQEKKSGEIQTEEE